MISTSLPIKQKTETKSKLITDIKNCKNVSILLKELKTALNPS